MTAEPLAGPGAYNRAPPSPAPARPTLRHLIPRRTPPSSS